MPFAPASRNCCCFQVSPNPQSLMAGHQLKSNGVAEARTGAPSLLFIVPQKIISCLHQSVAYATVNLAGSCEEMRLTGAEESLPGNMPCLLDGAGSILGTYGSQAWIFPFALFPEKEESQEKKVIGLLVWGTILRSH